MSFQRAAKVFVSLLICWNPLAAQTPHFDVATIKPGQTQQGRPIEPGLQDGRFQALGTSLKSLLSLAYDVQSFRIVGPSWLNSDLFDVAAKIPDGALQSQWPDMLQTLLTERFKISLHRETKETDVFEMVPAKGGLKLPSAPVTSKINTVRGLGGTVNMRGLGGELSGVAGRPVIDGTGREGTFFYFLNFDPRPNSTSGVPDLFTAVQEQLGIKLEAKKAQIESIVIDKIERTPSEN